MVGCGTDNFCGVCGYLPTMIGKVKFKHCPRSANGVAHELARKCYVSNFSCNWVDEPPSFILDKLIDDVTIVGG